MTQFAIYAALVVLAGLALLLPVLWFGKRNKATAADRKEANLAIFRDQLADLEREHQEEIITREEFEQAHTELKRRLLEEVESDNDDQAGTARPTSRPTAIALILLLPLAALLGYLLLGNPKALDPANTAPQKQMTADDINAMVARLAARMETNPDDLNGWVMLGRSYKMLGRYDDAVAAGVVEPNAMSLATVAADGGPDARQPLDQRVEQGSRDPGDLAGVGDLDAQLRHGMRVEVGVALLLPTVGVERLPDIYGFTGAWIALTLFTYPYVLLTVRASYRRLDPSLEEASLLETDLSRALEEQNDDYSGIPLRSSVTDRGIAIRSYITESMIQFRQQAVDEPRTHRFVDGPGDPHEFRQPPRVVDIAEPRAALALQIGHTDHVVLATNRAMPFPVAP